MESFSFQLFYQRIVYVVLHYCSFWMILACAIAAGIAWRLFNTLSTQNADHNDISLAWWTATVWGSAAMLLFAAGLFFA